MNHRVLPHFSVVQGVILDHAGEGPVVKCLIVCAGSGVLRFRNPCSKFKSFRDQVDGDSIETSIELHIDFRISLLLPPHPCPLFSF